jgi:hypothetical protein
VTFRALFLWLLKFNSLATRLSLSTSKFGMCMSDFEVRLSDKSDFLLASSHIIRFACVRDSRPSAPPRFRSTPLALPNSAFQVSKTGEGEERFAVAEVEIDAVERNDPP